MATFIFFLVLIAIAIGYFFISLVTINPNETGWRTILGAGGKKLESGTHFCPKWISVVIRYTKNPLIFKLRVPSATTKNGFVKDYKEDISEIERADLEIDITLMTYFDHNNLAHTASNAPGNSPRHLGPAIEPFILGIFRAIASEMPWPLFIGEKDKVTAYALSKIVPGSKYYKVNKTPTGKSNTYFFEDALLPGINSALAKEKNPLVRFGLDMAHTSIEIEDVNFTNPELAKLLNSAEEARMTADAGRIASNLIVLKIREEGKAKAEASAELIKKEGEAKADAKKLDAVANADFIKKEGAAHAEARKLMIAEIKDNTDLEYLRTLEQMAKGTSNTILYQIPKSFEEKVSQVLGGNKPEDMFAFLKDPKIIEALKEALEKLNK